MAKKKEEVETGDGVQKPIEEVKSVGSLEEQLKQAKAKLAAGEDAALSRVCKALNLEVEEIKKREIKSEPEAQVKMFVRSPVNLNGRVYVGWVTVGYETSQALHHAIGARTQRILEEAVGRNYMLKELIGGGYAPVLIGVHQGN